MKKISRHFYIQELVAPEWYAAHGDRCVDFINPNLPVTLDDLADNLNDAIIVNNWNINGPYKSSGLRAPDDVGAKLSTHKAGCTADAKFKNHTIPEVFNHIMSYPKKYPYISRIESITVTPTWLHIEVSTLPRVGDIIVFNP